MVNSVRWRGEINWRKNKKKIGWGQGYTVKRRSNQREKRISIDAKWPFPLRTTPIVSPCRAAYTTHRIRWTRRNGTPWRFYWAMDRGHFEGKDIQDINHYACKWAGGWIKKIDGWIAGCTVGWLDERVFGLEDVNYELDVYGSIGKRMVVQSDGWLNIWISE